MTAQLRSASHSRDFLIGAAIATLFVLAFVSVRAVFVRPDPLFGMMALASAMVTATGCIAALRGISTRWIARLTLPLLAAQIIALLVLLQQSHIVFWFYLFPTVSLYLLGRREGGAWTALWFAGGLWALATVGASPSLTEDLAVGYLLSVAFALGYETLRLRAEQDAAARLAEAEQAKARMADFADIASDHLFEIDASLRFHNATPSVRAAAPFRGLAYEAEPLEHILSRLDPANLDELLNRVRRREPVLDYVFSLAGDGDATRSFEVRAIPRFDADDGFLGYRCAIRDISVLQQQSERLQMQERALAQAQKMEAVGQLTGGIAHDFNNLVTVIRGNLELIREDMIAADIPLRHVDTAITASTSVSNLTQRLLSFSRNKPLNPECLDVAQVIEDMGTLLQRTLGDDITLVAVVADGLWPVHVDRTELESALLNLALNARTAMPEGGRLQLSASNLLLPENEPHHWPVAAGRWIRLSVQDEGCGIAPEHLQHVMEPFFTTRPVGEGSGLGLSMVYGFARRSGGALHLTSEVDRGTEASILLPAKTEAAPA